MRNSMLCLDALPDPVTKKRRALVESPEVVQKRAAREVLAAFGSALRMRCENRQTGLIAQQLEQARKSAREAQADRE